MTGRQGMWLFLLGVASLGCGREAEATGPDDVVREFVASMRRVHGDVASGEAVVRLLWEPARDNLKERARRASALSGRELSSGEMLVPSWFALHVSPERVDVREDGDWAEVTVSGPGQDPVQMRCIKESGVWKVALELPPLAPIRQRDAEQ
jgi:hypothetical protein